MAVTINDVAKAAGVSITTVSRVLNNNYPVKRETREKIEKAIQQLNYRPNAAARSLITKKTSMISVIVPEITNLFFSTIVESIENFMKCKGYNISLCNTSGDNVEEKKIVDEMLRQVDGIILIDPTIDNLESRYLEEISTNTPLIIINGDSNKYNCNFVCYNEKIGTKQAFDYFLSLGHRKIAFVRGLKSFSYGIKEKIYKDFIEYNHLEYRKIINVGIDSNSIDVMEKTESEFKNVLESVDRPTAVFACNDLMAVGIMNICNKSGLKIPKDISIIGSDNTLISRITTPKLTSVDLNMENIGYRAAHELIYIIENSIKAKRKVVLDTSLIKRESCTAVQGTKKCV